MFASPNLLERTDPFWAVFIERGFIMEKFRITNGSMVLDLVELSTHGRRNVALLRRVSDGIWITCQNIRNEGTGYSWDWGHYFVYENSAREDFERLSKDMIGLDE